MSLQEMRAARAKAVEEAKAIRDAAKKENRDLTADEAANVEELLAQVDELSTSIEAKERSVTLAGRIDAASTNLDAPRVPDTGAQSVQLPDTARVTTRPNYDRRSLQAFCSAPGQVSERDEADAYHCGMMLAALVGDPESEVCRSARRWCLDRDMDIFAEPVAADGFDPRKPEEWGNISARLRAAAQTGAINEYGGAVTPTVLSNRVIDLATMYGAVRREMLNSGGYFPVSAETTYIPRRTGGMTAYFVGDAAAATESRTSWDNVAVAPKELVTLQRVPMSLMEDSIINWADRAVVETGRAFAEKEDKCAIDGDGTSTYGGMTGIRTKMVDGDHAGSYNDATAGDDQWPEYIIGDFLTLVGTCKRYAGSVLKWWVSPMGNWGTFQRLAYAGGGVSGAEFVNGVTTTKFVGYPVVESEAMPAATTAYNELVVVLFGDIGKACTFADRRSITIRRSDQRYFEYRQVGILGTERFDFVVHDIGDGSNAGPLVGLRGNTA